VSHGPFSTADEYAELDRLAQAGLNQKEIAKRMRRSTSWVCEKLKHPLRRSYPKGQRPRGVRSPALATPEPWKPGDPKPDWLRRER
jgi:hypothetical protein